MKKQSDYLYDTEDPHLVSVLDEVPLWSAPFGIKLLDTVNLKKNISALDVGFGTGFPLLELAMRLGDTCRVYGIDPWKPAITRTKKKMKYYGIKNVRLFEGVAEKVPLENRSIDLIVSNNGINNVADIANVFSELARVAKPKAQFVMTMNLDKTMIEFYRIFEKVLLANNMKNDITLMHEHIYKKRKPVKEINSLLVKAGFSKRNLTYDSFSYRFTDSKSFFNHYFMRLAFLESWEKIVPPVHRKKIFSLIKDSIDRVAEKQKEFKLTVPFVVFDYTFKGD